MKSNKQRARCQKSSRAQRQSSRVTDKDYAYSTFNGSWFKFQTRQKMYQLKNNEKETKKISDSFRGYPVH